MHKLSTVRRSKPSPASCRIGAQPRNFVRHLGTTRAVSHPRVPILQKSHSSLQISRPFNRTLLSSSSSSSSSLFSSCPNQIVNTIRGVRTATNKPQLKKQGLLPHNNTKPTIAAGHRLTSLLNSIQITQHQYRTMTAVVLHSTLPIKPKPEPIKKLATLPKEEVEEMQRLRTSNPEYYTLSRLARLFNVEQRFVSTNTRSPPEYFEEHKRRHGLRKENREKLEREIKHLRLMIWRQKHLMKQHEYHMAKLDLKKMNRETMERHRKERVERIDKRRELRRRGIQPIEHFWSKQLIGNYNDLHPELKPLPNPFEKILGEERMV